MIRPYRPSDIEQAGPAVHDIAGMSAYKDHMAEYAQALKLWGPAFTAVLNGVVLGSAGLIRVLPWRATTWAWISSEALDHPFVVHRSVLKGLNMLMKDNKIHRADAEVSVSDQRALEWIVRLGFVYEGDMPGCGPNGETYARFGKVTTWDS